MFFKKYQWFCFSSIWDINQKRNFLEKKDFSIGNFPEIKKYLLLPG